MHLTRTSDASSEAVSLTQARTHLSGDVPDADDTYITKIIKSARMYLEALTRRALPATQTWTLEMEGFGEAVLWIPRPPLIAISSIAYLDTAGDSQTFSASNYIVSNAASYRALGQVSLAYNQVWPTTYGVADDVTITFTAGYASLPEDLFHAHLLAIEKFYEGCDTTDIDRTIEALVSDYMIERYV